MTENPEKTIGPPEDASPIERDPGKIHEQAQKLAANSDGLIKLLQAGRLLDRTKVAEILGEMGGRARCPAPHRGDE